MEELRRKKCSRYSVLGSSTKLLRENVQEYFQQKTQWKYSECI
jgi:hypothetical protein